MQNDPFALSWPVQPDQILSDEPEPGPEPDARGEEWAPYVQPPSQPLPTPDQWLTTPPLRRRTWMDDEDDEAMLPFRGAALAAEAPTMAASPAPSLATQGPRRRRRLAMSWTSICIALSLLLFIGYLSTIYLRSNVQQPGSGVANGVELHPTPILSPLAQLQTPVPTATPRPTPTTPAGAGQKKSDPQATPTPGKHPAVPTPTASGTTGSPPPKQATVTPVTVPTPVPTTPPTGGPTPVTQPTATTAPFPTATTVPPTPTPIPQPTATAVASAGSLSFTDQSEQVASSATWTGCPGGCSFGTQPVSASTHESQSFGASGREPQTQLSGSVTVTYFCLIAGRNGCTGASSYNPVSVSGNGWTCPVNQQLALGQTVTVGCTFFNQSSPTFLPPNTISGEQFGIGGPSTAVQWSSSAFNGNGGAAYETQGDCNNALSVVASAGWSWLSSTWSSNANGNVIAQNPSEAVNGWSCFPGVDAQTNSFTASVNASMSNGLVYNPAGPSNAAAAGLRAAFPGGWNDTYNSAGCYPSTVSVSGTTVVASCQDSALLTYAWTPGDMAGLAQAVVGQGIGAAEATCNGTARVAGNCVATSNGHDMPTNAGGITVSPQAPANPFGSADVGGGGSIITSSLDTAWTNLLPVMSFALLCAGCTGELRRRRKSTRQRKVVD